MNWYKKNILAQIPKEKGSNSFSVEEGSSVEPHYTNVGHTYSWDDDTTHIPNYLWVFIDGQIYAEEETREKRTHHPSFMNMLGGKNDVEDFVDILDRYYSGRYESSTGRVSLKTPKDGVKEYRDIPPILIRRLREKFPSITQILTY